MLCLPHLPTVTRRCGDNEVILEDDEASSFFAIAIRRRRGYRKNRFTCQPTRRRVWRMRRGRTPPVGGCCRCRSWWCCRRASGWGDERATTPTPGTESGKRLLRESARGRASDVARALSLSSESARGGRRMRCSGSVDEHRKNALVSFGDRLGQLPDGVRESSAVMSFGPRRPPKRTSTRCAWPPRPFSNALGSPRRPACR